MLYPKSREPQLSPDTFRNPGAEYRGTPFWSWNTRVTEALVREQVAAFQRMGFGGFHIHPRTGMETAYMSDEYLRLVGIALSEAKQRGMLCWLYDEDRYPSGAAGGTVTENVAYRSRHLLLTLADRDDFCPDRAAFDRAVAQGEKSKGYYVTSFEVILENGRLAGYNRCARTASSAHGRIWHAYMELMDESPWYNDQTYLDAMNPDAVRKFIELTHEKYFGALGSAFGKSIPAIFTDEPHVKGKQTHPFADSEKDITLAYTDDFSVTFRALHGYDILDHLPELLWELPDGRASAHRWRYHDHVAERFVSAFCDTLGDWCGAHGIALTGHFLSERTLYSQTLALGEALRCYRSFQLPGVDVLVDQKELSTVKQAVSVARQYGREGVISELYGSTHWDFDFKGHKLQGDWQMALGVTIRCPHLAFMSMEGEAKRDWPASIFYQSPWHEKYTLIEDHFARVGAALTRGTPICRVGVIHPIESFWLSFGPNDQTQAVRDQMDENFENIMRWLLYGLVDFDLISESMLPTLCETGACPLPVGQAKYDAIVVPDLRTIRSTTLARLEAFVDAGGHLIFAGRVPELVDAEPSDRAQRLAARVHAVSFMREPLLAALSPHRVIGVVTSAGKPSANLIYQMREDAGGRWLFLAHVHRKTGRSLAPEAYELRLKGNWQLTVYDTETGETRPAPASYAGSMTIIPLVLHAEDSLLLRLEPTDASVQSLNVPPISICAPLPSGEPLVITAPSSYRLSEPNALLLDVARLSLDGAPFGPPTEILRLDNQVRAALGLPRRQDAFAQPWRLPDEKPTHHVRLQYSFLSEIEADGCFLAIERPAEAEIQLNGERAEGDAGYYVDSFIRMVPLPHIRRGGNRLEIALPFVRKRGLESVYILGDFGVSLSDASRLVARPALIGFGDITRQGFPFYTGNTLYTCAFQMDAPGPLTVSVPHFAAPVLEVLVDGISRGLIAYAPHRLLIPTLAAGEHRLEIAAYGNRFNGFGTLHNANDEYMWYGPDAYRTQGEEWSDGYRVRPAGILSRVELYGARQGGNR